MHISVKLRVSNGDLPMRLVEAAEHCGAHGVWLNEPWGFDACTLLGFIAAKTAKIRIGTHVISIFAQSAAALAGKAAALQLVSAGRFRLGIGTSGPRVAEAWHGTRFDSPVGRQRDVIEVVRLVLSGQPLSYRGQSISVPLPDSGHQGIRFAQLGQPMSVPIHVAALGPANVSMTAELADGWLPYIWAPELAAAFEPELQAGAAKRNASLAPLYKAVTCGFALGDSQDARDLERASIAFHLGAMGTPRQNFYFNTFERLGFGDLAARVQTVWLRGDHEQARREVTDDVLDIFGLIGSERFVTERLLAYERSGIDEIILQPRKAEPHDQVSDLERLLSLGF